MNFKMKQGLEKQTRIMCPGPGETEEQQAKCTELGLGGHGSRWAERFWKAVQRASCHTGQQGPLMCPAVDPVALLVSASGGPRNTVVLDSL